MPQLYAIALPVPLDTTFDYLPPADSPTIAVGARVKVPFGRGAGRMLVGVVVAHKACADGDTATGLKTIAEVIDEQPLVDSAILALCQWASRYYHYPIGETLAAALPKKLRAGASAEPTTVTIWQLTVQALGLAETSLKQAPKQKAALDQLRQLGSVEDSQLKEHGLSRTSLKQLHQKGLVQAEQQLARHRQPPSSRPAPHALTEEQQDALSKLTLTHFNTTMLEGATGSGKTEIYLQAITQTLAAGKQALVIIPEIGLSPQTLARFQERFVAQIITLHSALNDSERQAHWLLAQQGVADIVIGTRSAIFAPLPRLGLIVVDEEHDLSLKQQDSLRYSARDLAVVRGQMANAPVILGSATPSLETIHNIALGRYQHLRLQGRPGGASHATIDLHNLCSETLQEGFSDYSLTEIGNTLAAGQQVLVFVNRRGFAPTLLCHDCGWQARCNHCDSNLTVHQQPSHLRCHHCDFQRPLYRQCPQCFGGNLLFLGAGTEKVEQFLGERFGRHKIIRIDRDSTQRKNAFEQLLQPVHAGDACVMVGTQMLVKGHHFPKVTLVVVLDADGGLFGSDFRSAERTGQMLLQVAGRAGRADLPGRVLIQTHNPDHPLFTTLFSEGYRAFTKLILNERHQGDMPPFAHLAILRAESTDPSQAQALLQLAKGVLNSQQPPNPQCQYLGPMPAIMERVNQRYRLVLQIKCSDRKLLHRLLSLLTPELHKQRWPKSLRWSLDVDPMEIP
ncbi:primosomal protein N' [Halioxenophilus sp. WMMB6]|uniref:primosomal protein N' n=1 Tax=Halioxenophilus sp. WMMB6 TaxID=3073815 RepID=UPI00295EE140|nr:primosomal protein N' [Halioxenophilus sp. WMMB6]